MARDAFKGPCNSGIIRQSYATYPISSVGWLLLRQPLATQPCATLGQRKAVGVAALSKLWADPPVPIDKLFSSQEPREPYWSPIGVLLEPTGALLEPRGCELRGQGWAERVELGVTIEMQRGAMYESLSVTMRGRGEKKGKGEGARLREGRGVLQ